MPIVIKDAGINIKRIPKTSSETKFTNYLRYRATRLEEFANPCHAPKGPNGGQFCETRSLFRGVAELGIKAGTGPGTGTPAEYHTSLEELLAESNLDHPNYGTTWGNEKTAKFYGDAKDSGLVIQVSIPVTDLTEEDNGYTVPPNKEYLVVSASIKTPEGWKTLTHRPGTTIIASGNPPGTLEEFANQCHDPKTGQFCETHGGTTTTLVKRTQSAVKSLQKELDAQGVSPSSPIRGVITHGGSHTLVNRDAEGKINGALTLDYDKSGGVSLLDFRALQERQGIGTNLLREAAKLALTTKDQTLTHHCSVGSAIAFYQKHGAEYTVEKTGTGEVRGFSSYGTVDKVATKALAEGNSIDKRTPDPTETTLDTDANGNVIGYNHVGWKVYSQDGGKTPHRLGDPYVPIHERPEITASISEFFNDCHDPDTGQFCDVLDIVHTDEKPRGTLPGSYTISVKQDGKEIGYVKLNYRSDIKSANVEELLVHPRHRRQGIGSRLMDEALDHFEGYNINHGDRTEEGVKWWETYHKERGLQASLTEFYNSCHAEDGRFCETHGVTHSIQKASPSDHEAVKQQVADKIANAPVPSAASVKRARALPNSSLASQNSADRRRQRQNLFKEFGGEERGYVVDAATGVKMHWTNDPEQNPNQYPLFERGRIFTENQGGGYQLPNLIPELYDSNRARGDKPIRKENT